MRVFLDRQAVSMVEAVLFDFGGVLTKPERVEAELEGYDHRLGLPEGSLKEKMYSGPLWEDVSTGRISEEDHWQRVAAGYAKRLPLAFSRFRSGTLPFEELNHEVVAIVRFLKGKVRLGLLSNASISLRDYLEQLQWPSELFDDLIVSAEVGLRKPDPRIYVLAANRLGVHMPGTLLIDDKARNTMAARECGMQTITFETAEQLRVALRALDLSLAD